MAVLRSVWYEPKRYQTAPLTRSLIRAASATIHAIEADDGGCQPPKSCIVRGWRNIEQADGFLFGRVSCEMMDAAFRPAAGTGVRPDWMEPFARTINAAKKYVISGTLERVERGAGARGF